MQKILLNKIFLKFLVVFFFPLSLTVYLFPPEDTLILSVRTTGEFRVDDLFREVPTFKSLVGKIFQSPLHLNWYVVTIRNVAETTDPDCLKPSPPIVGLQFYEGDPRTYKTSLTEGEFKDDTSLYESEYPNYYLKGNNERYFLAFSSEKYSIGTGIIFSSYCELPTPYLKGFDRPPTWEWDVTNKFELSIKPYWPAWVIQYLVLLLFNIFLISSCLTIWNWLRTKNTTSRGLNKSA